MMKRLFLLLFYLNATQADEIAVITGHNSVIKEINAKRIAHIFLKKNQFDDMGQSWIPLNLPSQNEVRLAFSQSLFNKRPEEMENYWNLQYFQGINPPYVVASEEAMLLFIASTPNAIGYALPCHIDDSVRILWKITVTESLNKHCVKK